MPLYYNPITDSFQNNDEPVATAPSELRRQMTVLQQILSRDVVRVRAGGGGGTSGGGGGGTPWYINAETGRPHSIQRMIEIERSTRKKPVQIGELTKIPFPDLKE